MHKPKIKVIIADDHELLRDGLLLMLQKQENIEVVGVAKDGLELVNLVCKTEVDIVLADIEMPKMDGIKATAKMVKEKPEIGVIALTMHNDDSYIMHMLQAGAIGYVFKGSDKSEILSAIENAYKGENYYCRSTTKDLIKKIVAGRFKPHTSLLNKEVFTVKEMEIIVKICQEKTSKEIALELDENVRTVEGIRRRIMQKLNVRSNIGVVLYAVQNGIFTPGK